MDAKVIARYVELDGRAATLNADEKTEYIKLLGEVNSFAHKANKSAEAAGIKVATTAQQTTFANAVDRLVFNIECQMRYSMIVSLNAVKELNTIANSLGLPQYDSPMEWYAAITDSKIGGAMRAVAQQGMDDGRKRNHWPKAITEYAALAKEPLNAPINFSTMGLKVE